MGEITDLAVGGFDIAGAISKIVDIASLAKTLKTESNFFKLLRTLRTDADVAKAAGEVEDAMSASSLLTRGKFGKVVEQVQSQLVSCFDSDLGGFIMWVEKRKIKIEGTEILQGRNRSRIIFGAALFNEERARF